MTPLTNDAEYFTPVQLTTRILDTLDRGLMYGTGKGDHISALRQILMNQLLIMKCLGIGDD